jgi:hypothetical protein
MDSAADFEEESIEFEFARTIKYIDLYMQQKTDLFLQHYVFEPIDYLLTQVMYLSVIVTLLAAGTLIIVIGVVLFIATLVPLWTSLLITGIIISGAGLTLAHVLLSNKIVLKTPFASEMIKDERP